MEFLQHAGEPCAGGQTDRLGVVQDRDQRVGVRIEAAEGRRSVERHRNDAGPRRTEECGHEIARIRHHHGEPVAFLKADGPELGRAVDRFRPQPVPAQEVFLAVTTDKCEPLVGTTAALVQGGEEVCRLWQLIPSQSALDCAL